MIRSVERDLHVLKYFSSVITVSEGRVINVTDPSLRSCPLARHFYPEFKNVDPEDGASLRHAIQRIIESKIRHYGFFTKNRTLHFPPVAVPCGASEMLSAALKSGFIETAVVVCDGVGTVVTRSPETVQGIGARMNTLIFTSPIKEIQKKLKENRCTIVSGDNAWIDQVKGVEKAISLGCKKTGVTVAGFSGEKLESLRALEIRKGVEITILAVCTTGISHRNIEMIRRHADLVWACGSGEARHLLGKKARLQISREIPVYALTQRGVEMAFSFLGGSSRDLADPESQYLVSLGAQGISLGSGKPGYSLRVASLPVESSQSPRSV